MEDKLKQLLDALPEKPQRSRLEPYAEFIFELRRRRRTYREIATILAERCQISVASSTVVRFVRVRSGAKRAKAKRSESGHPEVPAISSRCRPASEGVPSDHDIRQRIEALKRRPVVSDEPPKVFHYDPNEPLHVPDHVTRSKPGER